MSCCFEPGTLRRLTQTTAARALASGVLLPISSTIEVVEDGGVSFQVRRVTRRWVKDRARRGSQPGAGRPNPFLPYEPQLYVADASATHVCLLNKFSVVSDHLLIVTREFQHQQSELGRPDFEALWRCLAEYDSLAFYNSGPEAGASQLHRHLQLIPWPPAINLPLDPRTRPIGSAQFKSVVWPPYQHAFERLTLRPDTATDGASEVLHTTYQRLLASLGLILDVGQPPAYNLLVTRDWMLAVPRLCECFRSISLNSLAFVGAMLVHDNEQLNELRIAGPMTALKHVAGRAPGRNQ